MTTAPEDLIDLHAENLRSQLKKAYELQADQAEEIKKLDVENARLMAWAQRVEVLDQENERLREARDDAEGRYSAVYAAKCLVDAEVERLRAEVEASHLREMALRDCLLKNTPEVEIERLMAWRRNALAWLRANANAEQHPLVRQAFIEAYNALKQRLSTDDALKKLGGA